MMVTLSTDGPYVSIHVYLMASASAFTSLVMTTVFQDFIAPKRQRQSQPNGYGVGNLLIGKMLLVILF